MTDTDDINYGRLWLEKVKQIQAVRGVSRFEAAKIAARLYPAIRRELVCAANGGYIPDDELDDICGEC